MLVCPLCAVAPSEPSEGGFRRSPDGGLAADCRCGRLTVVPDSYLLEPVDPEWTVMLDAAPFAGRRMAGDIRMTVDSLGTSLLGPQVLREDEESRYPHLPELYFRWVPVTDGGGALVLLADLMASASVLDVVES